jgi:mRNA interferase RelE/StbE
MKIEFYTQFDKQIDRLTDETLKLKISNVVKQVMDAQSLSEIKNLKKLKGSKSAYRIRIGEYRIGFIFESNTIYFATIANRKEIYKRFP